MCVSECVSVTSCVCVCVCVCVCRVCARGYSVSRVSSVCVCVSVDVRARRVWVLLCHVFHARCVSVCLVRARVSIMCL